MGASCCKPSDLNANSTVLVDLPAPKNIPNDKLEAWEIQSPFARCAFKAYLTQLVAAHQDSGGKGSVELGQLVQKFNTPVWKEALRENSQFVKFLKAKFAKGNGFDYDALVIFGLLHCKGKR